MARNHRMGRDFTYNERLGANDGSVTDTHPVHHRTRLTQPYFVANNDGFAVLVPLAVDEMRTVVVTYRDLATHHHVLAKLYVVSTHHRKAYVGSAVSLEGKRGTGKRMCLAQD